MKIRTLCVVLLMNTFPLSGMEISQVTESKNEQINHRSLGDLAIFPIEIFAEIVGQLLESCTSPRSFTSFRNKLKEIAKLRKVNKYCNRLFKFIDKDVRVKFMPKIVNVFKLTLSQAERDHMLDMAMKMGPSWSEDLLRKSGARWNWFTRHSAAKVRRLM